MSLELYTRLLDYGIAGVALVIMYNMWDKELRDIRALLIEIRNILSKESD